MVTIRRCLLLPMILMAVGCASVQSPEGSWRGMDVSDALEVLGRYSNVFAVRITADHIEQASNNPWSIAMYDGIVIKPYKGVWQKDERVAFTQRLDYVALPQTNVAVDVVVVLLTNVHTNEAFAVDAGELELYTPEGDKALSKVVAAGR